MANNERGVLHQPVTNTTAHRMSSAEEALLRYWDADPDLLRDPFDVAAKRAAREAVSHSTLVVTDTDYQRECGFVAPDSMVAD
ncbi:hypothetical protein KDA23_06415 [Candidatus Saccharibacteria bacterium]|nr:hypothetical protein [Candidatus Saccharibacteria bacterium]